MTTRREDDDGAPKRRRAAVVLHWQTPSFIGPHAAPVIPSGHGPLERCRFAWLLRCSFALLRSAVPLAVTSGSASQQQVQQSNAVDGRGISKTMTYNVIGGFCVLVICTYLYIRTVHWCTCYGSGGAGKPREGTGALLFPSRDASPDPSLVCVSCRRVGCRTGPQRSFRRYVISGRPSKNPENGRLRANPAKVSITNGIESSSLEKDVEGGPNLS